MREEHVDPLVHPEFLDGVGVVYTEGGTLGDLLTKMHKGDPTKGWEGDPRLQLYYDRGEDACVVVRLEPDGEYRLVTAWEGGPRHDFIDWLVAHDVRRGYNAHQEVWDNNERVRAEQVRKDTEHMLDVIDRTRHAAKRHGGV